MNGVLNAAKVAQGGNPGWRYEIPRNGPPGRNHQTNEGGPRVES